MTKASIITVLVSLRRQSAQVVLAGTLKREVEGDELHLSEVLNATLPSAVLVLLAPRVVVVGGIGVELRGVELAGFGLGLGEVGRPRLGRVPGSGLRVGLGVGVGLGIHQGGSWVRERVGLGIDEDGLAVSPHLLPLVVLLAFADPADVVATVVTLPVVLVAAKPHNK